MLETTPAAQSSLLTRTIQREIEQESPVRAVLIFGPRRIGKTTLLRQIIGQNGCRWFNGDIEGSAADLRFQSQGDVFKEIPQDSPAFMQGRNAALKSRSYFFGEAGNK